MASTPHEAGGVAPFGWMPESVILPTYRLRFWHRHAFGEFTRRAQTEVAWASLRDYSPAPGDPAWQTLVDEQVSHWARMGKELWLLVDRDWFGFPDPFRYSLVIIADGRKRELGQFWDLPAGWSFPALLKDA